MHRVTGPDAGNHPHRAGWLDLIYIDNARCLQNAQMRCLLGLGHQAAQMRLGAVPEVVLLNGSIAKVEKAQAQAELAARGALNHAVPLQNHEKAMGGALVKL
jgi:hypothetical protein